MNHVIEESDVANLCRSICGCALVSHRLTAEQVEQAEMARDYLTVWHAGTLKYCVCGHSTSYL